MRAEMALWCALLVVLAVALPVAAVGPNGAVGTHGGVGAHSSVSQHDAGQPTATATPTDQRTVHLDVQLLATGDANWTVTTYVPLDGESDRESFRELGYRYENGTADVDADAETFRRIVDRAEAASGRDMRIPEASVERSWAIENGTGMLTLQFRWTNFAREQGDRYAVDDAFRTETGTWLPELESGQVLVIRPPDSGRFVETPKRMSQGTLRWEGPVTFDPGYFEILYKAEKTPTTSATPPTKTTSTTPPMTPTGSLPSQTLALGGVLAVGALFGYLWIRRRPRSDGEPGATPASGDGGGPPAGAAESGDAQASDPITNGTGATEGEPPEPTPEDPFAGVDVDMLSDEERVLRLLDANGGRMKQAQIVKETDWSNAKVSQLLSSMDEDEEIDKLRIGRENLISLPDVEVDSFQE
jgi:hypothetical protein